MCIVIIIKCWKSCFLGGMHSAVPLNMAAVDIVEFLIQLHNIQFHINQCPYAYMFMLLNIIAVQSICTLFSFGIHCQYQLYMS